jgi:hypothetical protein
VILFDAGPIVASAVTADRYHRQCVDLLATARANNKRLLLPATVTAEAGYLLDSYGGPRIEARFLRGVGAGEFEVVDLIPEDYTRMSERHFPAVRPRYIPAFTLLPENL